MIHRQCPAGSAVVGKQHAVVGALLQRVAGRGRCIAALEAGEASTVDLVGTLADRFGDRARRLQRNAAFRLRLGEKGAGGFVASWTILPLVVSNQQSVVS